MTIVATILVLLLLYLCGKRFVPTLFKVMIGGRLLDFCNAIFN